jgi:hypothetical protein
MTLSVWMQYSAGILTLLDTKDCNKVYTVMITDVGFGDCAYGYLFVMS